ncbi:2'-5' RNA ligase superfamily protein [Williamsia sterculiae]|uniref:2'-5' RNA ligase superfamily protein n=1 Tax=Williamsia sterculiae TaxID=1344003 RepID=A0A1N7H568_9NOCA|nr:2'-5' RNA ligase superfamily protein [Williamsia sterculiae]
MEFLLDADTDAAVRELWDTLSAHGLPSQNRVRSASNRPHITAVAAPRIPASVDADLGAVAAELPVAVLLGAPLVFGGRTSTLALGVVVNADLLGLHRHVVDVVDRHHEDSAVFDHCRPGQWTPHVTVARRVHDDDVGAAIAVINRARPQPRAAVATLRRWDPDTRTEHSL